MKNNIHYIQPHIHQFSDQAFVLSQIEKEMLNWISELSFTSKYNVCKGLEESCPILSFANISLIHSSNCDKNNPLNNRLNEQIKPDNIQTIRNSLSPRRSIIQYWSLARLIDYILEYNRFSADKYNIPILYCNISTYSFSEAITGNSFLITNCRWYCFISPNYQIVKTSSNVWHFIHRM